MILQDLVIPSRVNLQCEFSGIDSPEHCLNKDYFRSYLYEVDYVYNSRGFRDAEWPESLDELKNAIWCVGDSFTVGIGQPIKHTWPQVLSAVTGRRCINISMDGASNDWISRRAQQIVNEIAPKHMIVLWSYFHRRENPNTYLPDDARTIFADKSSSYTDDLVNFANCYKQLNTRDSVTNIFNGLIPHANMIDGLTLQKNWNNIKSPSWPKQYPKNKTKFFALPEHIQQEWISTPGIKENFEMLFMYEELISTIQFTVLENLDFARDCHHFDLVTSEFFAQEICKTLFPSNHTS